MVDLVAAAIFEPAVSGFYQTPDLVRGAIAGALIVAAAILAGYAFIRRNGVAVCAFLMVTGAGLVELFWLGYFPGASADFGILFLGLFAAAAIIFLSASVGVARYNALVGGVLFTAALCLAGLGVINFFDRVDVAGLLRWSVMVMGGVAGVLAAWQAVKGDIGARLILPGLLLALAAPLAGPFVGPLNGVFSAAPHALFALGVIAASMVAFIDARDDGGVRSALDHDPIADLHAEHHRQDFAASAPQQDGRAAERDDIYLDSQLARVLDYSGLAAWDWSPDGSDHTASFGDVLGVDGRKTLAPTQLQEAINAEDRAAFEKAVMAPSDGPFDVSLTLASGERVRVRGARAADEATGELERIVAFAERTDDVAAAAASVPSVASSIDADKARRLVEALDKGEIEAVFQPIVSLKDDRIAGYEALARWRGGDADFEASPESLVKAADEAGKGGLLSRTMLDQAVRFLSEKLGEDRVEPVFAAINLSWGQMREPAFADALRKAIDAHKLPSGALVLELTEGEAVSDAANARSVFSTLKRAGAALAFDDFGAGFSCLSNLRKYDFDYLKIDKSFAADLERSGDGAKIAGALAALGKELGLRVIVEGIETKAAARAALAIGCPLGQGFALGEPARPEPAIPDQIASGTPAVTKMVRPEPELKSVKSSASKLKPLTKPETPKDGEPVASDTKTAAAPGQQKPDNQASEAKADPSPQENEKTTLKTDTGDNVVKGDLDEIELTSEMVDTAKRPGDGDAPTIAEDKKSAWKLWRNQGLR